MGLAIGGGLMGLAVALTGRLGGLEVLLSW